MSKLEDLVLFESANSALAFRELAYTPADIGQFLKDALALANAEVEGPRFLVMGVLDVPGSKRAFPGLTPESISRMRRALPAMLARSVEPRLRSELRLLKLRDADVAVLCFRECDEAPYLLRKSVAGLPAGVGWLRRGTTRSQLRRADLERLFARRLATTSTAADVRIAFAGDPPCEAIELPVLDLADLPSALAAKRLRQLLEGQEHAKDVLGKTETRMSRLLHAQIFGIERPYEQHSSASLRLKIDKANNEHAVADQYYELAVRAHKLELVAHNRGDVALESVVLRLRLPNLPGIGVADKAYSAAGVDAKATAAYPLVRVGNRVIDIEADIGSLAAGATVAAFREPPRLWLREDAAGKSIALDYEVHARELREPVRDTLVIRIVRAASARPRADRKRDRARA
jgi:hypothetical protein